MYNWTTTCNLTNQYKYLCITIDKTTQIFICHILSENSVFTYNFWPDSAAFLPLLFYKLLFTFKLWVWTTVFYL